ncbi:class I SAM-dependent methyltransferase [Pyrobaculum aerophilum]|uniref:Ubiquinone/menaquinone biosynthesis methyltransferase (UbiE), conjectural n=2 Tax=Pyrobaculum aerophilum TaxID=13773 RepID=Q8ZVD4_PYRAE|nr:class I SAM-dependent methyltransferase [Pyrobaculum aerophilum]AAL64122.1 ubiquinone/menaquinone biosynthesis methyltransferase (ubiE), conjectural [Pyrobaculum aerophilum str. IM2]MCX8137024.1 class I SAM-dependent methyltransferase [Pyrobaculum aerophilum]RFA93881.1 methyltransferase type 11 [Pyrobaculum aerophilum]RFB00081.1 methyltransferase type 11 [Pyrobaculum aerophilum]HII47114.1 class I SAM-dependent methyltransferase [Pyrobaculum aerophilum]
MGLGGNWRTVQEAYRKIAVVYEKANMLATLGNVDRWRKEAISLYFKLDGKTPIKVLDAGAGPGNMALHIKAEKYVVALDVTPEMLLLNTVADDKVVGMFEYMPFRAKGFDLLVAGYSLHAAVDIEKAVAEFSRVAGYQVVVSIGNPDNVVVRKLLLFYTKYVLPRLVCIVAPKEICNEYKKIYTIVKSIPTNAILREIIKKYATILVFKEKGLGSVYLYIARSLNAS